MADAHVGDEDGEDEEEVEDICGYINGGICR